MDIILHLEIIPHTVSNIQNDEIINQSSLRSLPVPPLLSRLPAAPSLCFLGFEPFLVLPDVEHTFEHLDLLF